MQKEVISLKEAISIVAMFVIGTSLVVGGSNEPLQDSWISLLIGYLAILPFIFIYAKIMKLFPGKNLFEISIEIFGKFFGRVVIVLYLWYALHLGGLILRDFSEFIQVSAIVETPQILILIFMSLICVYAVKSGIETFGRWSLILTPILIFVVFLTVTLAFKDFNFSNLLPVWTENSDKIASSAFVNFAFPYGESVLIMGILSSLKPGESTYKAYFWGLSIAALIIVIGNIRNILLLGTPYIGSVYYPSYAAVKHIIVGSFFSRIEGTISANFLLAGTIKVCVCLFAASKGFATLFKFDNYKKMAVPAALIMIVLAMISFQNTMEVFEWVDVYKYYVLPFQALFPIIILIGGAIKIRHMKKRNTETSE